MSATQCDLFQGTRWQKKSTSWPQLQQISELPITHTLLHLSAHLVALQVTKILNECQQGKMYRSGKCMTESLKSDCLMADEKFADGSENHDIFYISDFLIELNFKLMCNKNEQSKSHYYINVCPKGVQTFSWATNLCTSQYTVSHSNRSFSLWTQTNFSPLWKPFSTRFSMN